MPYKSLRKDQSDQRDGKDERVGVEAQARANYVRVSAGFGKAGARPHIAAYLPLKKARKTA